MSLQDVIGHDAAVLRLRRAIEAGKVASSYIFAGERGIGKKYTAIGLASALNCKKSRLGCQDLDPEACPSCRKIRSGSHPDVFFIEPENGAIKIDVIRDMLEALSLRSFEGGYRVVIVDEAETMTQEAANAFLKTLEEPPPGCVIALITESPDALLETIRSRCVRINFRPLSAQACRQVLEKHGGLNNIKTAVALSMCRPGIALKEDFLKEREQFIKTLRQITGGGTSVWKEREDIERWLDICLGFLRDMAVMKISGRVEGLINQDIGEDISKMCERQDLKVIIECYEKLLRLRGALRFNLSKKIIWNYVGSVLKETVFV